MISPGLMPLTLSIAVGAQPNVVNAAYPMQSAVCAGGLPQVQSCIIDWSPTWIPAGTTYQPASQHTHYHFAAPAPLSDADVERIARRVAELLRETP